MRLTSDDPKDPNWFVITREMPEQLSNWKQYFLKRLGFMPYGIKKLESGEINSFLVPTEKPEAFDGTAAPLAITQPQLHLLEAP